MADDADEQPTTTTVTIKNVSVEAWTKARAAHTRQGGSMGEWLSRAVTQLADREAGIREILPDERPRVSPRFTPVSSPVFQAGDLALLRETMLAARAVSEASGVAVPRVVATHAFALLSGQLRAARGLAPPRPRAPRQTLIAGGQTEPEPGQENPS